jgi:large subunit ribosomal protein L22
MEKQAIAKYLRISASKAREITRLIQDKPVEEALAIVDFTPRKAGHLVGKVLRSAIANAENSPDLHVSRNELYVKEAVVGEGPTMKRFRPKARGMAGPIRRRSSHIKIIVSNFE